MLFGESLRQQPIADRAGERDVHDPTRVHMPYLCISKSEFPASEAVRVDRDLRPRAEFVFEPFQRVHIFFR